MRKIYTILGLLLYAGSFNAQVNFNIGSTVPNFTVTDSEGNTHTLYNYTSSGKYVLIDFYAYWCGPCMATAPTVVEFYHKYGCNAGNVIVLGVEYEGTWAQCHTFEVQAGIDDDNPYPYCAGAQGGGAAVHSAYGVAAFPTLISISPQNILLDNDIWPISGVSTLEAAFPNGSLTPMACSTDVTEDVVAATLSVFPNPADDVVNIRIPSGLGLSAQLVLMDATGRQVYVERLNGTQPGQLIQVPVAQLATGLYQVVITAADGQRYSTTVAVR